MKKIEMLIVLLCFSFNIMAQVFNPGIAQGYTAFDTNGPMGECLFPTDSMGNKYQEIVVCKATKEDISNDIAACINVFETQLGDRFRASSILKTNNSYSAEIHFYVGSTIIDMPWVGPVNKQYSDLQFALNVEIKENKYRITCSNFYTDRVTIHGEAKSNGPSNCIHWQRVNSLKKERDEEQGSKPYEKLSNKKKKEIDEYNDRIRQEEAVYKLEYKTFKDFVEKLKNCTKEADF